MCKATRWRFAYGAGFALLLAAFLWPSSASAETAQARRSSRVYEDKGEQSKPVTRVRAGKRMTVLRKEGRWVKVRVNGRTGWIPRSSLVARRSAPKRRTESFSEGRDRRRDDKTAPDDRIGADATKEFVDRPDPGDEPDDSGFSSGIKDEGFGPQESDSAVVRVGEAELLKKRDLASEPIEYPEEGDQLRILERDGKWLRVETRDGVEGWVRSNQVEIGAVASDGGDRRRDDDDDVEPYEYEKLGMRAFAHIGFSNLGQAFKSSSSAPLGNYNLSANAVATRVYGEVLYDFSDKWLFGGDLRFAYARATPGISFMNETIPFSTLTADLGGLAGYKFRKPSGMALYGRLGFLYHQMDVQGSSGNMLNAANLPSESLLGPKIGAVFAIPQLTSNIGVSAYVDGMASFLGAKRNQSANLEDGASSKANAIFAGARGDYRWKNGITFSGAYDLTYATTKWTGAAENSQRGHNATDAERTDLTHTILLGAGYAF